MTTKSRRLVAFFSITTFAAVFFVYLSLTQKLITADNHPVPAFQGLANSNQVSFKAIDGTTVHGALLTPEAPTANVLLLHGIRANRNQLLNRSEFLLDAGYRVLAIDLRGHGETLSEKISFGYFESKDVDAAIAYLQNIDPDAKIGVIGFSLGGAAATLASRIHEVDALVLEAVYVDIHSAISNRLRIRLGSFGEYLSPVLLFHLAIELGFDSKLLSPIDRVKDLALPIFVIGGELDQHSTKEQTQDLYRAISSEKQLWIVEGEGHGDYYGPMPAIYRNKILEFLKHALSVD